MLIDAIFLMKFIIFNFYFIKNQKKQADLQYICNRLLELLYLHLNSQISPEKLYLYHMNKAIILGIVISVSLISILYVENNQRVDPFDQWKTKFGTPFVAEQEAYRRLIFAANLKSIIKHNSDSTQTYKMGINQFSIYTEEQFKLRYLAQMIIPVQTEDIQVEEESFEASNIEIDWTTKGAVSKVKNQGQCGSCWAFSATGVSQSWALLNKKTVDLSQQQLVDCSGSYGNHGCNGGWPESALKYVRDHGISSQAQYPYKAKTQTCQKTGGDFKISTITTAAGCTGLQNGIASRPLSVTVDATNWPHYSSGVFNNCNKSINHAVLLVGVVGGSWKVKNSWGTSWGEHGFIRLATGNTCGVCANGGVYPH